MENIGYPEHATYGYVISLYYPTIADMFLEWRGVAGVC